MKRKIITTTIVLITLLSSVSFAGEAMYYPSNGKVEIPQLKVAGDQQGTAYAIGLQQRGDSMVFDLSTADITTPSIVGSWGTGYEPGEQNPEDGQAMILVFYPNGYYFHYETGQESEPCDLGGGVEYGAYTYDVNTLTLNVTPLVDNNGCVGLSENNVPGTISGVSISNNQLFFPDSAGKPRVQN